MELLRKLKRRIGHRGAFLLFLALLDFLYGWSLIIAPITPKMHEVLPFDVWGFIWIAGGFACLVGAFMRMDRVSYGVAAMLKAGWAVAWVKIWWLNSDIIPRAWVSVAIWGAFSGLVVIVSTWPEDWRRRKVTTDLNLPESLDANNTREGGD